MRGQPVEWVRDDRLTPVDLEPCYEEQVSGQPNAFAVMAEDYISFAPASPSNLLLEIAGAITAVASRNRVTPTDRVGHGK